MRKYTKEISALLTILAAGTVGTTLIIHKINNSRTIGDTVPSDPSSLNDHDSSADDHDSFPDIVGNEGPRPDYEEVTTADPQVTTCELSVTEELQQPGQP